MRRPSTSRTSTLPSRSRATATVSRSKNAASRTRPQGRGGAGPVLNRWFPDFPASRLAAALLHVQRLVGHLVHGLPVHARLPGRDADAELDRHRHLLGAVQLVERLPHADTDLASIALVGLMHGDAELAAAKSAARVLHPHSPFSLLYSHPHSLLPP